MAIEPLTVSRLLGAARTSDLYDVVAVALSLLAERGEVIVSDGSIGLEHADIYRKDDGKYGVSWFGEANAEVAEMERGDQEGGF